MDDNDFKGVRKSLFITTFILLFFELFAGNPDGEIPFQGFELELTQQQAIYIVWIFWGYFLYKYFMKWDISNSFLSPYIKEYAPKIVKGFEKRILKNDFSNISLGENEEIVAVDVNTLLLEKRSSNFWSIPIRLHLKKGKSQVYRIDSGFIPPNKIFTKTLFSYCFKRAPFTDRVLPLIIVLGLLFTIVINRFCF